METVRFAIYSRKSVLTDRGESVENQVELCRRCLAAQYPDVGPEEIAVYEDEGFSGQGSPAAPVPPDAGGHPSGSGRRPWCATAWIG